MNTNENGTDGARRLRRREAIVAFGGLSLSAWLAACGGDDGGSVAGPGSMFLRGHQKSDADGLVRYMGRTTHIHVKAHVGGDEVHTGQLYFDDAVTATVGATEEYASRGTPDTTNETDGIYASGGEQSTLTLRRRAGGGYVGTLAMGVRSSS